MPRSPMNDQTRERARELHAAGMSRNAIARALDLDPATVTRWARSEGLEFDRSATDAATKAHTIDLAVGRVRLAEKMLAASEDMLDRIDDPYLVFNFGGKDNTFRKRVLDSAPVDVRRSIIVTAGITFDKLTRIVEKDTSPAEGALGVLDQVGHALVAAAAMLRDGTVDGSE